MGRLVSDLVNSKERSLVSQDYNCEAKVRLVAECVMMFGSFMRLIPCQK